MGIDMPSGEVDCGQNLGFNFQHSVTVLENGNIVTLDNGNIIEENDVSSMNELENTDITIEDEVEVEQGDLDGLDERKSKYI